MRAIRVLVVDDEPGIRGSLSGVLSDEGAKMNDKELIEDLIVAATNQALQKVRQQVAEETTKAATGLGLPPGFNLPGGSSGAGSR